MSQSLLAALAEGTGMGSREECSRYAHGLVASRVALLVVLIKLFHDNQKFWRLTK